MADIDHTCFRRAAVSVRVFIFSKAYTRVLQGHIGLATATFPDGTPGFMIDSFARRHLWDAGLDYQHGTGHGVGAALNVHEGPHVRSLRQFVDILSTTQSELCAV